MKKQGKVPTTIFGDLQRSGFPFQTAVAHVVKTSGGWSVHKSEYPWQDPSGKDEFLDLVITNGGWYAGVECKKTEKDTLNFLRPLGLSYTGEVDHVRCLHGRENFRLYCEDWDLWPRSFESQFCIMATSASGNKQRLLERDARLVVLATDAFARHQEQRFQSRQEKPLLSDRIYISIIVTNAPINAVRYKPTDVSLNSGRFEKNPEETLSVHWVRFRKAFTSSGGQDLGDRTVFVVNAEHFGRFIGLIERIPEYAPTQRNALLLK